MIYLLYGEENFLTKVKLKEIVKIYFDKYRGLNFFEFDFSISTNLAKTVFGDFKNTLVNNALFLDKKLIVLKNIFDSRISKQEIISLLREKNLASDKNIIIILVEDKKLKDTDLKEIKQVAKVQEFKRLDKINLNKFIIKEVTNLGGMINKESCERLAICFGDNLYRLKNELEKLVTYEKNITVKNIETLTLQKPDLNIFEITDNLLAGQINKVLRIFEKLIGAGESENYFLAMITSSVRSLIKVKSLSFNETDTSIHPYVLLKLNKIKHRFSVSQLARIYNKLLRIEIAIKSGGHSDKALLTMLFFDF